MYFVEKCVVVYLHIHAAILPYDSRKNSSSSGSDQGGSTINKESREGASQSLTLISGFTQQRLERSAHFLFADVLRSLVCSEDLRDERQLTIQLKVGDGREDGGAFEQ